jgi:hypothetical protein
MARKLFYRFLSLVHRRAVQLAQLLREVLDVLLVPAVINVINPSNTGVGYSSE